MFFCFPELCICLESKNLVKYQMLFNQLFKEEQRAVTTKLSRACYPFLVMIYSFIFSLVFLKQSIWTSCVNLQERILRSMTKWVMTRFRSKKYRFFVDDYLLVSTVCCRELVTIRNKTEDAVHFYSISLLRLNVWEI